MRAGDVDELRVAGDVPGRPDAWVADPQVIIDHDLAAAPDVHADGFQAEPAAVGAATDGQQQPLAGDLHGLAAASGADRHAVPVLVTASTVAPVRTFTPSASRVSASAVEISGSSPGAIRPSASRIVTWAPRRTNSCPSSRPM